MERQDLIDITSDAMSDAQDMDTTITDLAKAAVEALMPFMAAVDEHIKFAQECVILAAAAKGYPGSDVSVVVNFTHTSAYGARIAFSGKADIWTRGHTFVEAMDALTVAVADLPPKWSDADVAATLGIAA